MQAVVVTRHGGPEVLELREVDDPTPAADQLLVRTAAAGVNFVDTYERSGAYPLEVPAVLGKEGAGEVVAVGAAVEGVAVGDHVAWKQAAGSYAPLVAVPAAEAVPVPAGLDDATAAALMLQGLTAHYLCVDSYAVQPGDWVVVHAAAGGVGLLLTQLVRARGGRVIATTGGGEKAALARGAGADEVVGYDELAPTAARVAGEGVAAVYDGVGAATFDASLAALRPRGTLVLYGAASGPVPPVDPQRLARGGSLYLTRPTLVHFTRTRAELLGRCADILDAAASGTLDVRIGHRYPLAEARRAHEDLQARRTTGKLLLIP
jgi:NADPH2:quinone reductase